MVDVAEFRKFLAKSGVRDIPEDAYLEELLAQPVYKTLDGRQEAMRIAGESDAREAVRMEEAASRARMARLESMAQEQGDEIASLNSRLAESDKMHRSFLTVIEQLREVVSRPPATPQVNVDFALLQEALADLSAKIAEQQAPEVRIDFAPLVEVLARLLKRDFIFSPHFKPEIEVIPSAVRVESPINVQPALPRAARGWQVTRHRDGSIDKILPIE